ARRGAGRRPRRGAAWGRPPPAAIRGRGVRAYARRAHARVRSAHAGIGRRSLADWPVACERTQDGRRQPRRALARDGGRTRGRRTPQTPARVRSRLTSRARALSWPRPFAVAGATALAAWCALALIVAVTIGGA